MLDQNTIVNIHEGRGAGGLEGTKKLNSVSLIEVISLDLSTTTASAAPPITRTQTLTVREPP